MNHGIHNSGAGRIIGDILLVLAVLLTADVLFVMPARIRAVVLKADYRKVFVYELILCAALLVFALDVRFSLDGNPRGSQAAGRCSLPRAERHGPAVSLP